MANLIANKDGTGTSVVTTGNSEIDKKMGGGIPVNSLTIIEGHSDAGKSVLSQQMIWGSLRDQQPVVLFTTENTLRSFTRQMASLNLDVSDHVLLGNLKIFPIQATRRKWTTEEVFQRLVAEIDRDDRSKVVVIDSITGFVAHVSEDKTIDFFEECKRLCEKGRTIINVVHTYAFNDPTLIRIRSMCDAHLRLRIEELGDQLIKTLEVAKVRGADKTTGNIIAFDVEPMIGMRIIPITKAKA